MADLSGPIACGTVLLFFLQLLTHFVAASYALSLLDNRLRPEAGAALFLASPALLLLPPIRRRASIRVLAVAAVVARLAFPLLADTRVTMVVSGVGVGASLLLIAQILRSTTAPDHRSCPLGAGLALAVAGSICLRAYGSTVDVSTTGATQFLAWPLGLTAILGLAGGTEARVAVGRGGLRVIIGGLGMVVALGVLYLTFSAPGVISRWTGAGYMPVYAAVAGSLTAWAGLLRAAPFRRSARAIAIGGTALFAVLLMLTILGHQESFPSEASGYPRLAAARHWTTVALVGLLLSWPVVLLDFYLLARSVRAAAPSPGALGAGFAAGGLLLAAVTFGQIFTTTYDYVDVAGALFRDRFWAVQTAPVVVLLIALSAIPTEASERAPDRRLLAGLALLGLAAIGGVFLTAGRPQAPVTAETLKVATWNVQQGYDAARRRNFYGQLEMLRDLDADVIALQESDTARVAGGNDDLVRYLADRLSMHSYYGPKTVNGTFGLALLSRYPIENARTFYLFSEGEQTAAIVAEVVISGHRFELVVTHLGNNGPLPQTQEVLRLAAGSPNLVLMGDFNFRPGSQQYELTAKELEEAWLLRWPAGVDESGAGWPRRIDYVFVTPSSDVRDARYIENTESDHPVLTVTIGW